LDQCVRKYPRRPLSNPSQTVSSKDLRYPPHLHKSAGSQDIVQKPFERDLFTPCRRDIGGMNNNRQKIARHVESG
jgi:hypothetical protein